MKFSFVLPLLALGVHQTLAVTLPNSNRASFLDGSKRGNGGNRGGNGGAKSVQSSSTTTTTTPTPSSVPPINNSTLAVAGNPNAGNPNNAQTSLTLDPSQVQPNLANDGQAVPEAGQVPSLTSTNNFINFCLTQKTALTNGQQVKTGSCNPTIMGRILATTNLPSSKFVFPTNNANLAVDTTFTIKMAIKNMVTGNFVNAQANYYAAPCQVDNTGTVIGHSHVVVEALPAIDSTSVTNPNTFQFFKGLNAAAVNGVLTADVTGGLPAGAYRLASINTCANHQPVLGSIAQHGSFDDMVYFTVGGAGGSGNTGGGANGPSVVSASSTPGGITTSSTSSKSVPAATSPAVSTVSPPPRRKGGKKGGQNPGGVVNNAVNSTAPTL